MIRVLLSPEKKAVSIAHRIKSIIGFVMKMLPITYLGAPLYKGNKRKALFENLIDEIRAKVIGWEHCLLLYGGRLQLIRSVLSSMSIYLFQVLNPRISTIQKLEQLFAKFFWGSNSQKRKIHWTKWHNICFPTDEGGLGIRNLRDMITTFSYKLWWRLRLNNSLWSEFTISTLANLVETQCNLHIPVKLSKHGAFTTKSAWEEIRSNQPVQPLYRSLWSKLIMPNISVFAWRLIHNWIPVDDRLKQKGITLVSKCCCCEAEETVPHLFFHNEQSLEVWGYFVAKFQINIPQTNDIANIIQSWKHRLSTKPHIRDVILY
ncbi:UNVERIFIED_CONTAM: hypothetical protein Sradi_3968300 [Sesamum radiatum]|uniref:Reverse transcriptase zinc-binding domain-containing protein n=1 Tax=Sesamum radiatum TaxID=300843 RepID=A0AAW2PHK8_SESRA